MAYQHKISKDKLVDLYIIKEMTLGEIGNKYNLSKERIRQIMERYKIPRRSTKEAINLNKPSITQEKLKEMYINKDMTIIEIAKKLKRTPATVMRYKQKYNISKSNKKIRKKMAKSHQGVTIKKEGLYIYLDYHEGNSTIEELVEKYNYSYSTIRKIVNCKHWTTEHLAE